MLYSWDANSSINEMWNSFYTYIGRQTLENLEDTIGSFDSKLNDLKKL